MKKYLIILSFLLAVTILRAQVVISPPAGSSGSGTISTGATNDVPCYSAATTLGPCETGVLTANSTTHVLSYTNILATDHFGDGTNYKLEWDGTNGEIKLRNFADSADAVLHVGKIDIASTTNTSTNTGPVIYQQGFTVNNGGHIVAQIDNTQNAGSGITYQAAAGTGFFWSSSTTDATAAKDTGIYRNAAGVTEFNNGTPCSTQSNCTDALVRNLISTNGTAKVTISSSQATNQTLTVPAIRQSETVAIKPQSSLTSVASPAGTSSTAAFVMMGLGANITPQVTGRVMVAITGNALENTIGDGCNAKIVWGTGTNPANGNAASGTVIGSTKSYVASTAAGKFGAAFNALLTGAVINTQIWIDLQFEAVTGGTCTFSNMDVTAFEF